MKLTILGSGTCVPGFSKDKITHPPGFLLEFDKEYLLFECSQGIASRLLKMGVLPTDVKHIAISHSHPDHCALVHHEQTCFVYGLVDKKYKMNELNIYCPNDLKELYEKSRSGKSLTTHEWPKIKFHSLANGDSVEISKGKLSTYKAYHDFGKIGALAFRFEYNGKVFAYSGDTGPCGGVARAAKNADLFICEASARVGQDSSEYGHLNPKQAGETAEKAKAKKIMLFHHYGQDADIDMISNVESAYNGEVGVCHDFEIIEF